MVEENFAFESGLTWRSLISMLVAIIFFIPISAYLTLTIGGAGGAATAAAFVIVIIFSELTRYFGKPLTKHELTLMFSIIVGVTSIFPPYYWLIWRAFYISHPIFSQIILFDKPLFDLVPSWFIPKNIYVIGRRTFFQPEWFIPLLINTTMALLALIQSISLGMLFSSIFVEVEKLEFPGARLQASLITTLTERREEDMRIFVLSLIIGMGLGIVIFAPQILGYPVLPLPWLDLTSFTKDYLPGAIIGLATDPSSYITGMIIPLNVAICILASSFIIYIILNYVFLVIFPQAFPKWSEEYYHGMSIATMQYRSYLRIWLPVQFGMTIGMAISYGFLLRKEIYKAFRLLLKVSHEARRKSSGFPSLPIILSLFLSSSLASSLLFTFLVPEYNAYLVLFISLGYSFLAALITARALGIGAISPAITWPWRIVTYFSGYKGFIAWDFHPAIETGSSAGIVQFIKVFYLTKTRPMDYIKLLIVGQVIALLVSLAFYDFYWRIAPIPSNVYPFTLLYWPQYMLEVLMFATGEIKINTEAILFPIIISMAIVLLEGGLRKFGIIIPAVGFIIGAFQIPPTSIGIFIGSFISNVIIPRFQPDWRNVRFIVTAGITAGFSISVGIGIATSLLGKAPWIWPW